jgi:hypothetical protein
MEFVGPDAGAKTFLTHFLHYRQQNCLILTDFTYFTLRYFTLLTLLYFILLYFTPLDFTLL